MIIGLHSLKSGGASNDGYKPIDSELKDRNAGWKNARSKRRYIKRSQAEILSEHGYSVLPFFVQWRD